jgi:cytochrome c-type biogenesis protein CcmH/NrfF
MHTLLLWLAPLMVLLAAIVVALRVFRQRRGPAPAAAALTSAEEERLRALLADADNGGTSPSDEKR